MKSSKDNCSSSGMKFGFDSNRTECKDLTSIFKLLDDLFHDNVDTNYCQKESLQSYVSRMAHELKRSASILPAFLSSLGKLDVNLQEFEARNQVLSHLLENGSPSTISFPYNDIIEELNSHKLAIVTLIKKVGDLRADFLLDKKNEDVLYDNYVAKKTAERLEVQQCKSLNSSWTGPAVDKNIYTFSSTELKSTKSTMEFRMSPQNSIQTKDSSLTESETGIESETDSKEKFLDRSNICVKLDIQMPRRCASENMDECKIFGKVYQSTDSDVNFAVKNGSMEVFEKFLLFQDEEVSVLRKLTSCIMNLIARCQYLEEEKDTIMRALEQAKTCSQTICGSLHQQITALRGKYEILQATLTLLLNKFEHDVTARALSIPLNVSNENSFKSSSAVSTPLMVTPMPQYKMAEISKKETCVSMMNCPKEIEAIDNTFVTDELRSKILNDSKNCEMKEECNNIVDVNEPLQTEHIDLEKEMVAIIDEELAKLLRNK